MVADEEGIVVTPSARQDQVLGEAQRRLAEEAGESLDSWERAHRARLDAILGEEKGLDA